MAWVATASLVIGVGSSILSGKHAKKAAARQRAVAAQQAKKLRERGAEVSAASKREIDSMRTLRSLDLPAFKQASEQAMIQAKKGSERMQRQRMMGNLPGEVRDAIFGGQFQQYVGREMQSLGRHAALTQQILQATERQQQMALQVESQANQIETSGQMQAIQTDLAAGDTTANILGAVGQAASAYASAQSAKATAATADRSSAKKAAMLEGKFMENGVWQEQKFDAYWTGTPAAQTTGDPSGYRYGDPFKSAYFGTERSRG